MDSKDIIIEALLSIINNLTARVLKLQYRREDANIKLKGANECWPKVVEVWRKKALAAESELEQLKAKGE